MALETSRPASGKDLEDEARRLAAERRAWHALEAMLGREPHTPLDEAVEATLGALGSLGNGASASRVADSGVATSSKRSGSPASSNRRSTNQDTGAAPAPR